jgi:hypothetical protein
MYELWIGSDTSTTWHGLQNDEGVIGEKRMEIEILIRDAEMDYSIE